MKQKLSKKFAYWLGVVVVGIALGFAIQFVRAWTEPTGTPPSSNVGAPINTSDTPQAKGGANAPRADKPGSIVANDFCLPGAGGTCLSTGGSSGGNCICKLVAVGGYHNCSIIEYIKCGADNNWKYAMNLDITVGYDSGNFCYTSNKIATYFRCDSSITFYDPSLLYEGIHNQNDCTTKGGTVVSDGPDNYCRWMLSQGQEEGVGGSYLIHITAAPTAGPAIKIGTHPMIKPAPARQTEIAREHPAPRPEMRGTTSLRRVAAILMG